MGLNTKGILKLAEGLVIHSEMYDQNVYGKRDTCGTVCCLAGLCLLNQVGWEEFSNLLIPDASGKEWELTPLAAVQAGARQLGVWEHAQIFSGAFSWPADLQDEYTLAQTHEDRARVALKALRRLRESGYIDPDPDAIHTPIPSFEELARGVAEPIVEEFEYA
jgi:hypothetical protein